MKLLIALVVNVLLPTASLFVYMITDKMTMPWSEFISMSFSANALKTTMYAALAMTIGPYLIYFSKQWNKPDHELRLDLTFAFVSAFIALAYELATLRKDKNADEALEMALVAFVVILLTRFLSRFLNPNEISTTWLLAAVGTAGTIHLVFLN